MYFSQFPHLTYQQQSILNNYAAQASENMIVAELAAGVLNTLNEVRNCEIIQYLLHPIDRPITILGHFDSLHNYLEHHEPALNADLKNFEGILQIMEVTYRANENPFATIDSLTYSTLGSIHIAPAMNTYNDMKAVGFTPNAEVTKAKLFALYISVVRKIIEKIPLDLICMTQYKSPSPIEVIAAASAMYYDEVYQEMGIQYIKNVILDRYVSPAGTYEQEGSLQGIPDLPDFDEGEVRGAAI